MKILLFTAALFASSVAYSQATSPLFVDEKGTPIKSKNMENVTGSPYLYENWTAGNVKTASGKTFKDLELKYDVMEDKVIFKDAKGTPMYFSEPIVEFELKPADGKNERFVSGLPQGEKITNSSILQSISTGKIALYKKHSTNLITSKSYSGGTTETYNPSTSYYTLIDGKWSKISPSKKSTVALLPNKEAEISAYIKNEKIDFKQDNDLSRLFNYINTL